MPLAQAWRAGRSSHQGLRLQSFHGTLVYTNASGQQFYAAGTRSNIEQGALGGERLLAVANGVAQAPAFAPVQLLFTPPAPDIRIELRRGATAITVHWRSAEAAQCAVWMRELVR